MMKNKWKLLVSSLVTLLPIPVGLILWEYFSQRIILQSADNWSSKLLIVFAFPIILLIIHWICVAVSLADHRNKDQSKKAMGLTLWTCPFISLFISAVLYSSVFGTNSTIITLIIMIPVGLMLIAIGNYLPKCKPNSTVGIKVKWALENEENWNATHRFSGKLWFISGLLILLSVLLPQAVAIYAMLVLMLLITFIPMGYSYVYYRKQLRCGTINEEITEKNDKNTPMSKQTELAVSLGIIFIITVGTIFTALFIGSMEIQYGETSFNISTAFWEDLSVSYADIDSIDYSDKKISGSRIAGFGNLRLLMGTFQNGEYGQYTRYTYAKCDSSIVMNVNGRVVVISGKDTESTKEIYSELAEKIG